MTSDPATITIPARFCGPVNSANGGYICGLLAQFIGGPACVTLKAPPPLEVELTVEHIERGKSLRLMYGELEIAYATATSIDVKAPAMPSLEDIKTARQTYLDAQAEHPLPGCFVCGPGRSEGDGLRIFAGPAPDSPVNADIWIPGEDLAGEDGSVREEFLWAALDCPSAWATRISLRDTLIVLGRLSGSVLRRPKPGARIVVAAWSTHEEDRKYFSRSVLKDEDGETIAMADAVWIKITDPKFLQLLKTGS